MVAKLIDRTVEIGQAWPCPVRVYFVPDAESWKVLQQKYEGLRDYTGDSLGSACRWACENVTHVAVTIGDASKLSSFEVVGLIVHEATHVWQYIQEAMGETTPGNEQDAWTMEYLTIRLLGAYRDTRL